jgi:hypothetical protein
MTELAQAKKYNNYKVLVKIAMRIHNPQVIQAYRGGFNGVYTSLDTVLVKYLKVYPKDSLMDVLMKFALFYFVDGRLGVQSSNLTWWPQKSETFKPQLIIQYRPSGERKKFGYNSYAGNPQFVIPHYNGADSPLIPSFTIGQYSAQYTLDDQSYIRINASSEEEAREVVLQMAKYVKDVRRPNDEVKPLVTTSKRAKKPRMDGVKIEPFKGEYFTGGQNGERLLVRLQF